MNPKSQLPMMANTSQDENEIENFSAENMTKKSWKGCPLNF